jgi:hypothetical protein
VIHETNKTKSCTTTTKHNVRHAYVWGRTWRAQCSMHVSLTLKFCPRHAYQLCPFADFLSLPPQHASNQNKLVGPHVFKHIIFGSYIIFGIYKYMHSSTQTQLINFIFSLHSHIHKFFFLSYSLHHINGL